MERHGTTIAEYAKNQGIKPQAVYQQIKRKKNKDFIQEHSFSENGITYLDDAAVEYLEQNRAQSQSVVLVNIKDEKLEEQDRIISQQKDMIIKIQAELNKEKDYSKNLLQQITESQDKYLTDKERTEKTLTDLEDKVTKSREETENLKSQLDDVSKERDALQEKLSAYESKTWFQRLFGL